MWVEQTECMPLLAFPSHQCTPQGPLFAVGLFALRSCYVCSLSKYPALFLASIHFSVYVKSATKPEAEVERRTVK